MQLAGLVREVRDLVQRQRQCNVEADHIHGEGRCLPVHGDLAEVLVQRYVLRHVDGEADRLLAEAWRRDDPLLDAVEELDAHYHRAGSTVVGQRDLDNQRAAGDHRRRRQRDVRKTCLRFGRLNRRQQDHLDAVLGHHVAVRIQYPARQRMAAGTNGRDQTAAQRIAGRHC